MKEFKSLTLKSHSIAAENQSDCYPWFSIYVYKHEHFLPLGMNTLTPIIHQLIFSITRCLPADLLTKGGKMVCSECFKQHLRLLNLH